MLAGVNVLPNLLASQIRSDTKESILRGTAEDQAVVIAMFNVAMVGHVNPTFALVQELVRCGCRVHYFLPPNRELCEAAREAGANIESYVAENLDDLVLEECGDFSSCVAAEDRYAIWPLASTLLTGDHVLARCRELKVRLVAYDPMTPHGLLVAKALGIPGISLVTYPGMGCLAGMLSDDEKLARWAKLRRPLAQQLCDRFSIDVESELDSRIQWFSVDENLVTTSEALVAPLPEPGSTAWADEVRERFPCTAVGCTASESAPHITGPSKALGASVSTVGGAFPLAELNAAVARSAKIVYVALGSMAVGERWADDIAGLSSGGLPAGTTGKAFCQLVWSIVFEAMRELGDGYHCVLCVGRQVDALDFLEGEDEQQRLLQAPVNVTLRSTVQQVVMLNNHADVFVTHAGFNSLQESLLAGVPMIALPQAIDQPDNARKIEAQGWGKAFLRPLDISASELAAAVRKLTAEGAPQRVAAAAAGTELCHGEVRAAERLLRWVQ